LSQENEFHQKIVELLKYHVFRESSYKWVYHKAATLEAYSALFKKFAVHLTEATLSDRCSNERNANKLDNASMTLDTNQEIMHSENIELTELDGLLQTLRAHTGSIIPFSWQDRLKEVNEQTFKLPFPDPEDNQLFIKQFIIMKNEEKILRELFNAQKLLRQASELVEKIDLTPALFHNDLTGPRQLPRFLLVASELIFEGATTTRTVADLIQSNESNWRELNDEAGKLEILSIEYKKVNETRGYFDIDYFFKIISEWLQENLHRALLQFKEETEAKFLRVGEISKVWVENNPRYDVRTVDALIEYDSGGVNRRVASFQIDCEGKILGFNLFEPIRG